MAFRSIRGRLLPAIVASGVVTACAGSDETGQRQSRTVEETLDVGRVDAALTQSLTAEFPRATVTSGGGRLVRTFGTALANAAGSKAAAEQVRIRHAAALGLGVGELELVEVNDGKRVAKSNAAPVELMFDKATGHHRFSLY